jgi:hypothetical protein
MLNRVSADGMAGFRLVAVAVEGEAVLDRSWVL